MAEAGDIEFYFEDLKVGEVISGGSHVITRDAIIDFARTYDPQVFHLDEEAAKASILGGLSASGWHSVGILMRLSCDSWVNRSASWGGPGVDQLKWLKPVRPDDRLSARCEIVSKRESKSRPAMGLVAMHSALLNQRDEVVLTQEMTVMVGRRGFAPPHAEIPPAPPVVAPPQEPLGLLPLFYEDFEPGKRIYIGSYQFDAANIIAFARQFDPQPFHLSEEAGRRSHFGGLVASGWQSAAVHMRMLVDARHRGQADAAAKGFVAATGPSPGVREIAWPRPVRAGDTLHFYSEGLSARPTSRPGWALCEARSFGINQYGEPAFGMIGTVFVPMRG
ncbi:MAG: MaoC family dehydratase [Hyphomicrobiales bacterium]|nr:MaoC family dehydratase [Hyphomicrobiales bacterium]